MAFSTMAGEDLSAPGAPLPELGAISDRELRELIDRLSEREHDVSYERRLLHGRIDILHAELESRLRRGAS